MKGDWIKVFTDVIDAVDGGILAHKIEATKAGRKVNQRRERGIVVLEELTRTDKVVRTIRVEGGHYVSSEEHFGDVPDGPRKTTKPRPRRSAETVDQLSLT